MTEDNLKPSTKSALQQWDNLPFLAIHLMCLGALFTGVTWEWVLLAVVSYYIRMVGVTAGYHRYFSHRSYKTGRVFQFLLACLAMTSAQKGVLWWAAHHRHHHRHSDRQRDLHSPAQQGFWYSHVGWILNPSSTATQFHLVKDLARYPELMWLNRFYVVPPFLYAALMYGLWGMPGLIWGFFISTTALYHGTFFINSLSHLIGRVRYNSGDDSRNSALLAILCCGEGWHNNHHHYQLAVNQGWFWWEVDLSYYILRALSWTGVVWDLRMPPESVKQQTIAASSLRN
ncbi:MAG: fatty acid desaturase [Nitrospiraceae bacterium]|nr:fatty acid desaturase [Nitrospiraceae bacterium]